MRDSWGWGYQILPYVEQENLYRGAGSTTYQDKLVKWSGAVLKVYRCNSKPGPRDEGAQVFGGALGQDIWYRDEGGVMQYLPPLPNVITEGWDYRAVASSTAAYFNPNPDGICRPMTWGGPLRFADVTDGLTNTLMVGERWRNFITNETGSITDSGVPFFFSWHANNIRFAHLPSTPDNRRLGPWSDWITNDPVRPDLRFGSAHSAGVNFAFCDGSVRLVSFNVHTTLFQQLATRAGGEVAILPD